MENLLKKSMNSFLKLSHLNPFRTRFDFYKNYQTLLSKSIIENSIAISLEKKYVCCRIGKAANSTVVASLYYAERKIRIENVDKIQFIKDSYFTKPSHLTKDQFSQLNSFFKFTIVRNPYSRIWSAYLDKVAPIDRLQRKPILKFLDKPFNHAISFDEFLTFLENGGLYSNSHWAPQYSFLVFPMSEYDKIGKVESLETDLALILRKIYGVEKEIITVNEHKTKAGRRAMDMNNNERARVYKLYEADFENFTYNR